MTITSASPDLALPRHWAFASVAAWEAIAALLQDVNLLPSGAYLLDQLVAEFQADPLIQSDAQQQAIWAQLREQIAPYLKESLRLDLAECEIGGAR